MIKIDLAMMSIYLNQQSEPTKHTGTIALQVRIHAYLPSASQQPVQQTITWSLM
jgi:hypothetical protein